VAKHFSGHESSSNDSHLGIVEITQNYKEEELIPYEKLQKEGFLDSVMIAHVINRNVDANFPATLSPTFIEGILRNQIGFKGLVISDDAQMGAISENYNFEEAVDIIYNAVKRDEISAEKTTESYELIYKLKKQYLFDKGQ
jgi:beta-N-acetylhexosaminidase